MKRARWSQFVSLAVVAGLATAARGQLIISEVVDATLTGGLPKFVELTNTGCEDIDLSAYSFGNYSNGGTSLGGGAASVLTGILSPGASYVVAYEATPDPGFNSFFFDTYGFEADFFMGGAFVNGDDTLALFLGAATGDGSDATLVDVYGVIGVDGTNEPWEYTDSYAFRNPGILAGNAAFDAAEWTIAGANALEVGGDDTQKLPLILDVTDPGVHTFDAPACGEVVVINEIMQNPSAVSDATGEWLELYNPTGSAIDLDGWTLADNDTDSHIITGPLLIPAGGYLVLGNNGDTGTNGGVVVDYVYSGYTLANGADEVVLFDGSLAEIDRAEYDGGTVWPDPNGASMALIDPALDNNVGANWCESSVSQYGLGDFGTPGAANDCPAVTTGACCDLVTFVCVDDVAEGDCAGPDQAFTANTLCDDLNPPCVAPTVGACCDTATFICTDNVEEGNCTGPDEVFTADTFCDDLEPPCVAPVVGACCFAGYCADNVEEGYCTSTGGTFQGEAVTCDTVDCGTPPAVVINEIRIDQPGGDDDEYFELVGDPNTSLDGLFYVVIGDSNDNISGNVEAIIPLAGLSIDATGFFLAAEATFTLGTPTAELDMNFENSDNVTHLLVAGMTAALDTDLDVDRDCVLDFTPWAGELDRIALVEEENIPVGTECHYGPPQVGPDGTFVPGHAFRCPDATGAWVIGSFDPAGGVDTPGVGNLCPTGACCTGDACSVVSQTDCENGGGSYLGDDTVCEGDADGDGVDGQCGDGCPDDPNKTEPGICGCGEDDDDTDEDGVADCNDGCPFDPEKTEPGICGCGFADIDSDNDGALDCEELCDLDPNKTVPGICGCGTPDTDSDGDSVADCIDQCPGEDDTIDDNMNGEPDCTEFQGVPTVSTWGLAVLALLLLIGAKLGMSTRRSVAW